MTFRTPHGTASLDLIRAGMWILRCGPRSERINRLPSGSWSRERSRMAYDTLRDAAAAAVRSWHE